MKMKKNAAKLSLYFYSRLVSREKFPVFYNNLAAQNFSQQAFQACRERVEITMMDGFCQLIFKDIEVFLTRLNFVKTLLSRSQNDDIGFVQILIGNQTIK